MPKKNGNKERNKTMSPNEYQKEVQRTVMHDSEQCKKLWASPMYHTGLSHVLIAALKLNSESGELSDSVVKHLCYGQILDTENIAEECGDLLWYIALILEKIDYSMEDVMVMNIEKLRIRYPEKFTEQDAL